MRFAILFAAIIVASAIEAQGKCEVFSPETGKFIGMVLFVALMWDVVEILCKIR